MPSTATVTSQLGLPMRPPHHFPQRAAYDAGLGHDPSLTTEDYYARNWHGVTYGDLDGVPTPVTVRRVDKSGLLEIAETDPVTCPRPCVLTGAEDVAARTVPLRVDRSGLLEAVPEAIDQLEEHYNNDSATTKMLDEAASLPRGETLKVDADVNPRVFEGGCLLERPSSLEGQACPDEVDTKSRTVDIKALTEIHFDASKATERLSHLPFSPGPSLRLPSRNDPSRTSPLTGRCADSTQLRNQKSPELAARYTSVARKLVNSSQNPIMRERSQVGCSKDDDDLAQSTVLRESAVDTSETRHESLLAKENAEQEDDPPGEERAEAEGCEHTTVENLEEDEVSSFKGSNKLLDNDNVQTLRVIILSEQL